MKKVLVVDDERIARGALKRALEEAGYETLEAENGKEAFAVAFAERPDLIMTDLRMPEMDGQQLLEEIRAADWGRELPIILLTGVEETEALNKALKSNVTAYLTKSTPLDEVMVSVREVLA